MALDWMGAHAHEMTMVQQLMDGLQKIDGARIFGPAGLQNRYPVVSFMLDGVHPHDVAQTLDSFGVAVRAGHHCAQPLMDRFDLPLYFLTAWQVFGMATRFERFAMQRLGCFSIDREGTDRQAFTRQLRMAS